MPKSSKDWCARFIEDIAWRSKARRIRPDLPTEGWPVLYGDNDGEIHRDQEAQGDHSLQPMESTKRVTAHLCWERTCQRTVGLCHINLRLDKAGSSEKRFSAFSEAQGRPTANRARIWNHDLTYLTSSKQKNPVETSKTSTAGRRSSQQIEGASSQASGQGGVSVPPPTNQIRSVLQKNNTKSLFTHLAMIKHAVDQIKSATGIKTEKNLTK